MAGPALAAAPAAAQAAAGATSSDRARRTGCLFFALIFGVPIAVVLAIVVLILPGSELCNPSDGDSADPSIPGTWNGPGSLGGVAGTGVTAAELRQARRVGGAQKITAGPYRSTAYAPIAGGVNCGNGCGFTASGIAVDSGRARKYLIASNPKLLSYGSLVYIWPNPYSWKGPFVVADTGGDFQGSGRLDFYTFEPGSLAKALKWGNTKMVRVSAEPIVDGGPDLTPIADGTPSPAPPARDTGGTKWPAPVKGPVTSNYGPRTAPTAGASTFHEGMDYGVPVGTPVQTPVAGVVIFAGSMGGYGNYMCVLHRPKLETCYGHLSAFKKRAGQAVTAGETIALTGNTGTSSGPHLHFEVRRSAAPAGDPAVDPRTFLSGEAPDTIAVGGAEGQCPANVSDVAAVDPAPGGDVGFPAPAGKAHPGGGPGVGTHSFSAPPNNWQSDNAVDLMMPEGTPMFATEDGTISPSAGFGMLDASRGSRFGGMRFQLDATSGRKWYYAHLSRLTVRRGQRVKRGDLVGYSGVANGVAHLHLGVTPGNPMQLLGLTGKKA